MNEIFFRRIFFLTKQSLLMKQSYQDVIEKYFTWVDVQFLIFIQFPSLFNASRDFILSFVSYNRISCSMFYRILIYLNCAKCT